ncbi:YcjX family protein [Pseudoxanthobacter sp. M-2]|uniref:YcjX family protein n=1 Tax=Pseudoxanthobacter sp. M-2 TaxID=3078754 RepID=UPI0038FCE921
MSLRSLGDDARLALATLADRAIEIGTPTVRLGVTGLSRAGKTVFITALVHALTRGGRLPLFEPAASGRLARARLEPQPDDTVPRFEYEAHVADLVGARIWPQSTRRVAELRVTLDYESATFLGRTLGRGRLHLDIVDYPGEWLLDLALIDRSYAAWAGEAIARARAHADAPETQRFLYALDGADAAGPEDEAAAAGLAALFTAHLSARRADPEALAAEPPGRFLMPGDLAGSPALTFAPLPLPEGATPVRGTLSGLMERRYEAYRTQIVKPFFRDHFARLDRQIVLVDALAALDRGAAATAELERTLADVLAAFRPGRLSFLGRLVDRRIDRILFAATKADHLHHRDHDRLEAILRRLVGRAIERASFAGAEVDVLAIAAVRATREATVRRGGERLPAILGTPIAGESVDGTVYDGATEIALFPGDLPDDPEAVFGRAEGDGTLRFPRFRPPKLEPDPDGIRLHLPHIRLDRALQFLIGDRLA